MFSETNGSCRACVAPRREFYEVRAERGPTHETSSSHQPSGCDRSRCERCACPANAAFTAASSGASAAEAGSGEEEFVDDIIVVAEPGDQVRIDRRTYALRDDPAAQSTNMFDVLGRIPSVSVAPSGAVTLLGADNVTIQLNGQPVPDD